MGHGKRNRKPAAKGSSEHGRKDASLMRQMLLAHQQSLVLFPPPIPFYRTAEEVAREKSDAKNKDDYKEITLKIDPDK